MDTDLFVVAASVTLMAILFVLGAASNLLLLWAFRRRPALATTSNRFVGNLLVINLFSTLLLIPLICIDIWPQQSQTGSHVASQPETEMIEVECVLTEFVSSWVSAASMLATLLIGLDQYLGVLYALRYEVLIARSRSWLLLLACWTLSFAVAGAASLSDQPSIWYSCSTSGFVNSTEIGEVKIEAVGSLNNIIPILSYVILFALPTLLITLIYGRIYLEVSANAARMRRGSNSTLNNSRKPSLSKNEVTNMKSRESSPEKTNILSSSRISLNSNVICDRNKPDSLSRNLVNSIRHKISNASLFMQKHKDELHTAKISLVIVLLVISCWFPYHTSVLMLRINYIPTEEWPKWLRCMIQLLVVVYPSLSPWVFAYRCKKLQRELKLMFRGRRGRRDLARGCSLKSIAPTPPPSPFRSHMISRQDLPVGCENLFSSSLNDINSELNVDSKSTKTI